MLRLGMERRGGAREEERRERSPGLQGRCREEGRGKKRQGRGEQKGRPGSLGMC